MVAPVTGPFLFTISPTKQIYQDKRNWRQRLPYDLQLRYYLDRAEARTQVAGSEGFNGDGAQWFGPANKLVANDQGSYDDLISKSYMKMVAQIQDSAQFAVNLAEYRQALGSMTMRLEQIASFTRFLLRKNFGAALQVLVDTGTGNTFAKRNPPKVPRTVSASKSLANNWLEFSFGWKPLVQDIYQAVDLLQNPIKSIRPVGRASANHIGLVESGTKPSGFYSGQQVTGIRYARQGCTVTISNPNLFLANKLGLVNPAVVAWELIPFSFVVDWFVNVGEFLEAGTSFLGLTVTQPYATWGLKGYALDDRRNPFWGTGNTVCIRTWTVSHMERVDSNIGPSLHVRPARLWGWERCANAAALLTQLLIRN